MKLSYAPGRGFLLAGILFFGASTCLAQTEGSAGASTPGQPIPGTSGVAPFSGSVPTKLVPDANSLSLQDAIHRASIGSGTSNVMGAFKAHVVDADIGGTSTFLAMEERKIGKVLAPVSSYMGALASGTLFASNKLIETNPDALRAFLAAWVDTLQFIRDRKNKEAVVEAEMAVTRFSHSVQSKEYEIVHSMYTADCRFDRESLDKLKHSFVTLKLLKTEPDMSKLYTEKFLPPLATESLMTGMLTGSRMITASSFIRRALAASIQ